MKRVAFVTGASSGIGEATVSRLISDGFTVYAGARRLERMKGLESMGAVLLSLDLTNDQSITGAVEQILTQQGQLDVLINNAGYGSFGALEDVPIKEARQQFEVNVFGLARLIQLVTPSMRVKGSGKIVNVTSIGGKIYEPLGAWYHATKFAVEGLSDCLRLELKPFGIDVVIIEPGGIKTEWGDIAAESVEKYSGRTAYASQAVDRIKMLKGATTLGGSDPGVIANLIAKSIQVRRPKARYWAGEGAAIALTLRKICSDRSMDWVMEALTKRFSNVA